MFVNFVYFIKYNPKLTKNEEPDINTKVSFTRVPYYS